MKTVELFSGTGSFSKYARKLGYETFTVDNNLDCKPDLLCDLLKESPELLWKKLKEADIVWMSPPCQTFSMASGNTHWTIDRQPRTLSAVGSKILVELCDNISKDFNELNKIYFIENPRARMRWFLPEKTRQTVWYCQYGDKRAKPTDIWTNLKGWKGKQCHNGNSDHESAPRGSKTGTQGLKGAKERGVIPEKLFVELFNYI